jgi:hypothetical protein
MVKAFKVTNPGNPQDGLQQTEHPDGIAISQLHPEIENEPWLCVAYINGKRYFPLRQEWKETKLNHGDCVYFMPHVGDPVTLVILAVVAVAAVVVSLSLIPPTVADTPEPDPVFDLKGQKNQIRLGNPIEDGYGRVRMWPSYAPRAYNQYYGNDQFQFQLFCLGQGSWDIEEVRIEDTEISNFQEVTYEIYQPGELVTLFPDNVETSVEVGQLELYGPNESEFLGHSGPFVANAINTLTTHIEIDVVLPQGAYSSNDDGGLDAVAVQALFEYRTAGSNDAWQELAEFDRTFSTNTPQRFTLQKDVPAGRYEVRAIRTNDASDSARVGDTVQWVGLRAFLKSTREYGDVTMLAVRARSTNNLNDRASNRVNVVGTRKLPNWNAETNTLADPSDVTQRTASRSHVWAMVNILRTNYGANLIDKFIDLEFLGQEAAQGIDDGIFFDWIFDQRGTVWEAVKLPCFVSKSIPMLNGSRVTLVRDKPASLPTFFINPENTIENSFSIEKKLFELQEYDGLEIEYTDPDTWKPETVDCLLPGSLGLNLKKQKLQGVTDRQRAFELGMYLWTKETYERTQVNVTTGLEGYIPTFGDLGRIGSDIPRWGQSGFVADIVGDKVTLSDPVEFVEGQVHQLAIRGKHGQDLGPYAVTAGDNAIEVILSRAIENESIYFDPNSEPPYYLFGVSNKVGTVCRVANLSPNENEQVAITAIVDDQRRFADYGLAPVLNQPSVPPTIPDAPAVPSIEVQDLPNSTSFVSVLWAPAFGATSYILEQSADGVSWSQVDTMIRTNYTLRVVPGIFYVRVAAVNVGIGPFVQWSGQVGQATAPPSNVQGLTVQPSFTGPVVNLKWQASQQAVSYNVTVLTDTGAGMTVRCTENVTGLGYDFTIDEAVECGGLSRNVQFQVFAVNALGQSDTAATITVTNPTPAAVTGLSSVLKEDGGTFKIYTLSWAIVPGSDISFYKVFGSEADGFTPGAGNLKFEGLATSADVRIDDIGAGFPPLYWRVSAVDLWGPEFNASAQAQV